GGGLAVEGVVGRGAAAVGVVVGAAVLFPGEHAARDTGQVIRPSGQTLRWGDAVGARPYVGWSARFGTPCGSRRCETLLPIGCRRWLGARRQRGSCPRNHRSGCSCPVRNSAYCLGSDEPWGWPALRRGVLDAVLRIPSCRALAPIG